MREEIARHDALYFEKADPEISDHAYDQLKAELESLEAAFPELRAAAGPAIGDDRSAGFARGPHRQRMLSLDKTYRETGLRAFYARLVKTLGHPDPVCVIEPKIDGLAVSVTYEQGRLVRAVTRGDGRAGDDITAGALALRNLPRRLKPVAADGSPRPVPALIELRGEIHLTFAEFGRINREQLQAGEEPFAHPRNLAAGTIKQRDPALVAARRLEVVFFGWGACEPVEATPATQTAFHAQARAWGLPTLDPGLVRTARSADELWTAVQAFDPARREFPFPTDGAVVKLDAVPARITLGESATAPRWALAYKFAPDRAETVLRAIVVQVGRTGLLTPVAEFAPVELAGSTVTRASLHNRGEIERLDLRPGDSVYVEKAGEIIPVIAGVNLARRPADRAPFVFPTACPACATPVVQLPGEAAVRCPAPACPAQLRRRLEHFASPAAVNIAGFGPATLDALLASGRIKTLADLYRLRREDLRAAGIGARTADRLLAAIEQSKSADLGRVIHGLGLPQIGPVAARQLARAFGRFDALAAARPETLPAILSQTPGLGPATAAALLSYFEIESNRALLADLRALGLNPRPPAP